jgi:phosphosulfolactate synthase (CoM biosynthesis protein A)
MCYLCDERLAYANKAVDEILDVQSEYCKRMPERTQAQRVSDMANMWLTDMPFPANMSAETAERVQNLTLFLAAMTERVADVR